MLFDRRRSRIRDLHRSASPVVTATVVAAVLRLAYVLVYPQIEPLCPDCGMYDRVAVNFTAGRGFVYDGAEAERLGVAGPVVAFGPVYPAFLTAIYQTVGYHFTAVRVAQAIVGALLIPMMWPLATAAFGPVAARFGAWLIVLSPPLIVYSGMLLTEILSTGFLVCAIWLLSVATTQQTRGAWVAGGVAAALLILIRQEMLLVVAAMIIIAVWKARPSLRATHLVAYVLTIAVCVGAWTFRNYVVFGRLILVTTKGGEQLWEAAKGWTEWRFDDPDYQRLVRGRDPVERDSILRRDAVRLIAQAPGHYLALSLKRVPELWISSHTSYVRGLPDSFPTYWSRGQYGRVFLKLAFLGIQLTLLALAAWGAGSAWRAAGGLPFAGWVIALPIVAITLVHFFSFSTPRYQIPALPFVLAFAGVALARAAGPLARVRGERPVSRVA
jgi:4-amino-4-deoxy-L-arabinose transferase-like glycosyltransferase